MKLDLNSLFRIIEEEDKKIIEGKSPQIIENKPKSIDLQELFSLFEEIELTTGTLQEGEFIPSTEIQNAFYIRYLDLIGKREEVVQIANQLISKLNGIFTQTKTKKSQIDTIEETNEQQQQEAQELYKKIASLLRGHKVEQDFAQSPAQALGKYVSNYKKTPQQIEDYLQSYKDSLIHRKIERLPTYNYYLRTFRELYNNFEPATYVMNKEMQDLIQFSKERTKTAVKASGPIMNVRDVEPKETFGIDDIELEPLVPIRSERTPEQIKISEEKVVEFIVPEIIFRETDIVDNVQVVNEIKAYLTKETVVGRLQELVNLSLNLNSSMTNKRTNEFKQLINKLSIIDGILSIFKSFEATSAGTVSEQVVACLFDDAKRLNTKETTEAGLVTDVEIGGKAYAIKTVSEGSARKMSAGNFANTLVEKGSITLLDCTKIFDDKQQVVGLQVFEKEVTLGGDYRILELEDPDAKKNFAFIFSKEFKRKIETVQELIDAWQNPQNYLYVNQDERKELEVVKRNRTTRVPGFTAYKVSYKQQKGEVIELKETSENIKKQILILTNDVRENIVELKDALQNIAIGMSKFFISNKEEKQRVKDSMLASADVVRPATEKITTDTSE